MTTAVTPDLLAHATLGPLASRLVDVDSLPWQKTRYPGIEIKTLLFDRATGLVTSLTRMAPGTVLPDHEHVRIEQTFVLEGHLVDRSGPDEGIECKAGQFIWRPAGSRHSAWSPNGGVFLAVFQIPNRFYESDGRTTDMAGTDWESLWGATMARTEVRATHSISDSASNPTGSTGGALRPHR
jgi:quercetin dioxygenase-like cupin family protein